MSDETDATRYVKETVKHLLDLLAGVETHADKNDWNAAKAGLAELRREAQALEVAITKKGQRVLDAEQIAASYAALTPERVGNQIQKIFNAAPKQDQVGASDTTTLSTPRFEASYVDLDSDGENELLVFYGVGSHGTMLKVFGWRDLEFKELGRLGSSTPVLNVGDYDGDGTRRRCPAWRSRSAFLLLALPDGLPLLALTLFDGTLIRRLVDDGSVALGWLGSECHCSTPLGAT